MTCVTLTTDEYETSEEIQIGEIEHLFEANRGIINDLHSKIFVAAALVTFILIITTNGSLLQFIIKQPTKTFLDWMIVLDIILCFGNIIGVFRLVIGNIEIIKWCNFLPFFLYFNSMSNKLLSIGIVVYRYNFLLHLCK